MSEQESDDRCQAGCNKCILGMGQLGGDGPKGGRLVFLAAAAFISPLIHAVIGAVVVPMIWDAPASRMIGTLGGFAVGLVDSWALTRIVRGRARSRHDYQD